MTIRGTLAEFQREVKKLKDLSLDIDSLPFRYRKLSAELIHLRLYLLIESATESVALQLAMGKAYCDGTHPSPKIVAASSAQAEKNFKEWGRKKPKARLLWSNVDSVVANVVPVFEDTEHFNTHFEAHKQALEELRFVRNRIAHKGGSAARNYNRLIVSNYGVELPAMTPGTYLLTSRFEPRKLISFVRTGEVFLKTLCKAG